MRELKKHQNEENQIKTRSVAAEGTNSLVT